MAVVREAATEGKRLHSALGLPARGNCSRHPLLSSLIRPLIASSGIVRHADLLCPSVLNVVPAIPNPLDSKGEAWNPGAFSYGVSPLFAAFRFWHARSVQVNSRSRPQPHERQHPADRAEPAIRSFPP
jgi:hypothetical protein